jgi:hypothetical protein
VGLDLFGLRIVEDLYPLGGEPARGCVCQRGIDALEYMVTGIDQYDTHLSEVHVGVVTPQHVEDKIVCVSRSLYPCGASADEDESEQPAIVVAPQSLGLLETVDYVVANPEGVPQTLDVHGVLLGSRSAEEGGPAARRQDEVVVGEVTLVRLYFAGLEVYPRDLFLHELHS